ncbi:MAG: hypothetical protein GTO04_11050 [Planctomycetales bacterium]|nr:hypothetical protein [Planctomycetales bacterium]
MGKVIDRYMLLGATLGIVAIGALSAASAKTDAPGSSAHPGTSSSAIVMPGGEPLFNQPMLKLRAARAEMSAERLDPVLRVMPISPLADKLVTVPGQEPQGSRAEPRGAVATVAPAAKRTRIALQPSQNLRKPHDSGSKLSLKSPGLPSSSGPIASVPVAQKPGPQPSAQQQPITSADRSPRATWHLAPAAELVLDKSPQTADRLLSPPQVVKPTKPQAASGQPPSILAKRPLKAAEPSLDKSPQTADRLLSPPQVVKPTKSQAPSGQPQSNLAKRPLKAADPHSPPPVSTTAPRPDDSRLVSIKRVPESPPSAPPSRQVVPPTDVPFDKLLAKKAVPVHGHPTLANPKLPQQRLLLRQKRSTSLAVTPPSAVAKPAPPPTARAPLRQLARPQVARLANSPAKSFQSRPEQSADRRQQVDQSVAKAPAQDWDKQPATARVLPQQPPPRQPPHVSQVAQQRFQLLGHICGEHIRYGNDLACRGATHSARQEFIVVLNRVSQALDHTSGNHQYTTALQAGLVALREAEDFQTGHNRLSTDVDLKRLIATHQTQALKKILDFQHLTPVMAMQSYLQYGKEQLIFASQQQPVASRALYGLARLETSPRQGRPLDKPIRGPRAIALHQAALLVDQKNYAAANELGVLLAHYGQLDGAGDVLSHAAKLSSQPETWHNLARVYEMKGDRKRADQAKMVHHRLLANTRKSGKNANEGRQVYWVAPEEFRSQADSLGAPRSPLPDQQANAVPGSPVQPGQAKGPVAGQDGKSGRGALQQLGRLVKEKFGSPAEIR